PGAGAAFAGTGRTTAAAARQAGDGRLGAAGAPPRPRQVRRPGRPRGPRHAGAADPGAVGAGADRPGASDVMPAGPGPAAQAAVAVDRGRQRRTRPFLTTSLPRRGRGVTAD